MTSSWTGEIAEEGRRLRRRLLAIMARGVPGSLSATEFNELALEIFRFQVRAVPVYGAFIRNRGVDPDGIEGWEEIPAVPTRAFRELPLLAGGPGDVEAVFRTSGTTGGPGERGAHRVRDLALYRASLLPNARAHLHPDGGPLEVVALLPTPGQRPDSSLVHMAGVLAEEWGRGDGASCFTADPEWRLDTERLARILDRCEAGETPVLVLGTAFAFVHLTDAARSEGLQWRLPSGSRVMETGGFKGRSREVAREDLYRAIRGVLGVPFGRIVNEYGMTEMLSQFYEPVLRGEAPEAPEDRHLKGPPWVRTRILDPETLAPAGRDSPGLLQHMDLANLYSVSAVLTEDVGQSKGPGFRVHGRTAEAEPRGCSLTMEELLEVRERGRDEGGGHA